MSERRLFTASAVLRGHPDKLCDRISDALVDAHLTLAPGATFELRAPPLGRWSSWPSKRGARRVGGLIVYATQSPVLWPPRVPGCVPSAVC